MSITINGIIRRNLQEQVGWNAEQIDKIFSILDGLNVQDNLVVVPDMSYVMTDADLDIVRREVAFIAYNGSLYIKKSMDSSEAKFDMIFTISGGTSITFSTSEITVTLANGALGITNATYNAYSASQTDTKLATKANLSGADFTGAVSAPTLDQSSPNYTTSFNFTSGSADIQITNAYNRLIVVNGVLYAIANIKMKNISGASKNIGGAWGGTPYVTVGLSPDIASKIYDIDGVSAHEVGTMRKLITSVHASCISGTLGDANATTYNDFRFDLTNTASTNNVACYINSNQYITLAVDEEICVMARVALTLF